MPASHSCDPEKENYWRAELDKFSRSGLSGMEYCRRQAVNYTQFADWRQKIRRLDKYRTSQAASGDPDLDWKYINREARKYPTGVQSYCKDHGIDYRIYLRQVWKLTKQNHGEKKLHNNQTKRSHHQPRIKRSDTKGELIERSGSFAEVKVVENKEVQIAHPEMTSAEIVLPNSLIIRVNQGCPLGFISSLVLSLGSC